jgi:hypothetical protein
LSQGLPNKTKIKLCAPSAPIKQVLDEKRLDRLSLLVLVPLECFKHFHPFRSRTCNLWGAYTQIFLNQLIDIVFRDGVTVGADRLADSQQSAALMGFRGIQV